MNYSYFNLKSTEQLIEGVILRKLTLHKDPTGTLVETLREDWKDVLTSEMPFKMQYISQTPPSVARDENKWHVHRYQKDRFICVSGRIVTAVFDPREGSVTKSKLNLFTMGPENEDEMYMVIIPEETYHGFVVISKTPAMLANFPTKLYNPHDEGRVNHDNELNWNKVREDFGN